MSESGESVCVCVITLMYEWTRTKPGSLFVCRMEELTCGGMVEQVQEAFGETMSSVVSLCAMYPIACANSIGLLCTIPYTRREPHPSASIHTHANIDSVLYA